LAFALIVVLAATETAPVALKKRTPPSPALVVLVSVFPSADPEGSNQSLGVRSVPEVEMVTVV
jgi:hypothetical protein